MEQPHLASAIAASQYAVLGKAKPPGVRSLFTMSVGYLRVCCVDLGASALLATTSTSLILTALPASALPGQLLKLGSFWLYLNIC
jgi:hypothetical protein